MTESNTIAQPVYFHPKNHGNLIRDAAANGYPIKEIAAFCGVTVADFGRWRSNFAIVEEMLQEGYGASEAAVQAEMFVLATGGYEEGKLTVHDKVLMSPLGPIPVTETKETTCLKRGSPAAAQLWGKMTGRDWAREKKDVTVAGTIKQMVQVQEIHMEMTPEIANRLRIDNRLLNAVDVTEVMEATND